MKVEDTRGEQETVDLFLQIAGRSAVVAASALMAFFDKDPFHSAVPPSVLLLEVSI